MLKIHIADWLLNFTMKKTRVAVGNRAKQMWDLNNTCQRQQYVYVEQSVIIPFYYQLRFSNGT
jgi:hypothetical protein